MSRSGIRPATASLVPYRHPGSVYGRRPGAGSARRAAFQPALGEGARSGRSPPAAARRRRPPPRSPGRTADRASRARRPACARRPRGSRSRCSRLDLQVPGSDMMNCSASVLSTATSARTSAGTPGRRRVPAQRRRARRTARVAAMAALANRPDQLTGHPLERHRRRQGRRRTCRRAATTGSRDSRSAAARAGRRGEAAAEDCAPQLGQRGGRSCVGEHAAGRSARTSRRPRRRARSRRRRRPSPSPAPPGTAGPRAHRRAPSGGGRASSCVEAELAAGCVGPGPRVFGHRVQRCPGQVEPGRTPLAVKHFGFQPGQDPQVLRVALESAARRRRSRRAPRSPLCPYGGCPMSCASPARSTRSASQPSPTAIPRPICATSSEWVSRVRGVSLLAAGRPPGSCRPAGAARRECSTRARSRAKSVRCSVSVPGNAPALFGGFDYQSLPVESL